MRGQYEHFKTVNASGTPRVRTSLRHVKPLLYYTLSCLCLITALLVVFLLFFRPSRVYGTSMMPTLHNGDRLLLSCLGYEPAVGDIVAIRRTDDIPLIKRVVAVGGDRLRIDADTGVVYRNGEVLSEPYLQQSTLPVDVVGEIVIPEGELFVMGDNRAGSQDSRDAAIGTVSKDDVLGKVKWRIYPFDRMKQWP